jgi:protoporphyrinogen oxidase
MNKKDVCIIGAGIGGLTAGALLTKKGYKVTIFEKESTIGGRALSLDMSKYSFENYKQLLARFNIHIPFSEPPLQDIFKKKMLDGYNLDLGFHVIGGGIIAKIKEILSSPHNNIKIFESKLYEQKNDHYGLFVTNAEKIKMLPNIFRLLFSSEKTMKQLDKVSITDTIKKYGKGKTKIALEVNSRLITTVNNLDKISTGEVFRTQRDMRLKGVRYPKNGLSKLSQSLALFIKEKGGEIHINSPVSKIVINDNKAKGVIVGNKKYYFDMVVSNIIVQNIFTLVDEKHFPKNYVNNIKSLSGSGSLCAYYSLKEINNDLIGKNFIFIERDADIDGKDAVGMVDFMTTIPESDISPSPNFLVQSYIICTPEEAKNKKTLEKLKKKLDKQLEKIIPDFHQNLNWAIYPATWHLDGVAKIINNEKPEIKTPLDNLYLVGDCVNAPGIGINCAINSAQILTNIVENSTK